MNLVATSKITPAIRKWKPYHRYKDSGVQRLGRVPIDWELKKLKYLFRVVNGSTPQSGEPDYWSGDIAWATPDDLGSLSSAELTEPAKYITRAGYESCGTTLVPKGSLVLSTRAPIGHLALAGVDLCTNQGCKSLVFRKDYHRKFYYYFLITARPELESLGQGSTFKELSKTKLEGTVLVLPPDHEQHAIADFLDQETAKIDALVAKKERLIELLQDKRAALITRAVTKGLDPNVPMKDSGVEWLGEIPAHWEVRRIKFFTTYVTSGSRGWAEYYSHDGAIFLRIGNLTRTGIDLDLTDIQRVTPPSGAEGERTRVRTNDVLISITAYIGSVAVVDEKLDAYVNQHIALTRPVLDRVSPRWIAYCFLSAIGKSQFQQLLYGGTKDGLGLDDVRNLIAPLPPVEEQTAIVEFLDKKSAKTDSLIAKIREGIEKLKEYRTALISAAVTGKIDVREENSPRSDGRLPEGRSPCNN